MILYVLVCGKVPFDDASLPELHTKIKSGLFEYPAFLSTNLKNLISRMLVVEPSERASIELILAHPWLKIKRDTKLARDFIPQRVPLTLPINLAVVERMGGFNFGTKDQILDRLTNAILSSLGDDHLPSDPIISIFYLVSEKLQRCSILPADEKPQSAGFMRQKSIPVMIYYNV